MRILELEEKTSLTRDTIRYYERLGLISKPARESNGFRNYSNKNITELNFIKMAQDIGFTLAEIRPGVEALIATGNYCSNVISQLNEKKDHLKCRIEEDKLSIKKINNIIKSIRN
jgi:DNA-binding transcriptional MerR regulator